MVIRRSKYSKKLPVCKWMKSHQVNKKVMNMYSPLNLMSFLNSNKQMIPNDRNRKSKASAFNIIAESNRKIYIKPVMARLKSSFTLVGLV